MSTTIITTTSELTPPTAGKTTTTATGKKLCIVSSIMERKTSTSTAASHSNTSGLPPKRKSTARRRASLDSGRDRLEIVMVGQRHLSHSSAHNHYDEQHDKHLDSSGKLESQTSRTKNKERECKELSSSTTTTTTSPTKTVVSSKKQRRRHSTLGSVPIHNDSTNINSNTTPCSTNNQSKNNSSRSQRTSLSQEDCGTHQSARKSKSSSNSSTSSNNPNAPSSSSTSSSCSSSGSIRKSSSSRAPASSSISTGSGGGGGNNSKRSQPRSLALQMKEGIWTATHATAMMKSPIRSSSVQRDQLRESAVLMSGSRSSSSSNSSSISCSPAGRSNANRHTGNPNALLRKPMMTGELPILESPATRKKRSSNSHKFSSNSSTGSNHSSKSSTSSSSSSKKQQRQQEQPRQPQQKPQQSPSRFSMFVNRSTSNGRSVTPIKKRSSIVMGRRSSLGNVPVSSHCHSHTTTRPDPSFNPHKEQRANRDVQPQQPQRPKSNERTPMEEEAEEAAARLAASTTKSATKSHHHHHHHHHHHSAQTSSSSSMLDHILPSNCKFAARKAGNKHRRSSLSHAPPSPAGGVGVGGISWILSGNPASPAPPEEPNKKVGGKKSRRHSMEGRVPYSSSGASSPTGSTHVTVEITEDQKSTHSLASFRNLSPIPRSSSGSLGNLSPIPRSSSGSLGNLSPIPRSSSGSNGSVGSCGSTGSNGSSNSWRNTSGGEMFESLLTKKPKKPSSVSKTATPVIDRTSSLIGGDDDDEDYTENEDILLPLVETPSQLNNSMSSRSSANKGTALSTSTRSTTTMSSLEDSVSTSPQQFKSKVFSSDAHYNISSSSNHNKNENTIKNNLSSSLEDSSSSSFQADSIKTFMFIASSSYNSTAGETVSTATSTLSSHSRSVAKNNSGAGATMPTLSSSVSSQSSTASSTASPPRITTRVSQNSTFTTLSSSSSSSPSIGTADNGSTHSRGGSSRSQKRVTLTRRVNSVRDLTEDLTEPIIDKAMELDPIVTTSPYGSATSHIFTSRTSHLHCSPAPPTPPRETTSSASGIAGGFMLQPHQVRRRQQRRNTLDLMPSMPCNSAGSDKTNNNIRSKSSDGHHGRISNQPLPKQEWTMTKRVVSTYSGNGHLLHSEQQELPSCPPSPCFSTHNNNHGEMIPDDLISCGTRGSTSKDKTSSSSHSRKKKGEHHHHHHGQKKKVKKSSSRKDKSTKDGHSTKKKSKKEKKSSTSTSDHHSSKRKKKSKLDSAHSCGGSDGIMDNSGDISDGDSSIEGSVTDSEYFTDNDRLLVSEFDDFSCTSNDDDDRDDFPTSPLQKVSIISPLPSPVKAG